MKLICELQEAVNYELLEEENKPKQYFIEGIFMQSERKNKNGRIYPLEVLEKEVDRYVSEYVEPKRAFGELGHPDGPTVNLDRASHMIQSLKKEGKNFVGRAKILDTPNGKIVKSLIDEGARLGVSSRGMGTLKPEKKAQVVQNDFYLATAADIVADPSAPNAFVEGIMEGREWIWDGGLLREQDVERARDNIRSASSRELEEVKLNEFKNLLSKL
ncbi:MAG: primosomal protein [bacterium TMED264]|nr:MAG: primosomal protein [bacterium TMED264]|tara:strand:+ start:66 stop:713 length:648 start_codon:yes stop_codon:yes gene_type:complete